MTERIRNLLQRVAAASGSLDPTDQKLRERLPSTGSIPSMEREIASEIAYSLGRVGSKLALAIERAHAIAAEMVAIGTGTPEWQALVPLYEEQRSLAERYLRDLLIQREALGFRRHAEVHRTYAIPPRIVE